MLSGQLLNSIHDAHAPTYIKFYPNLFQYRLAYSKFPHQISGKR